jgi:hypothetical protein
MMEWLDEAANEQVADMQRELWRWRRLHPLGPARSIFALRAKQMSDGPLELSGLVPIAADLGT